MTPPALDRVVQALPREGPGGPLADRARRRAAAPVDRRGRLAGGRARARRARRRAARRLRVGAWARGLVARGCSRSRRALRAPRAGAASRSALRSCCRRRRSRDAGERRSRVSPGRAPLAFVGDRRGRQSAHLGAVARRLRAATPLAGTEGRDVPVLVARTAASSASSPTRKLKKIDGAGGPPARSATRRRPRRQRGAGTASSSSTGTGRPDLSRRRRPAGRRRRRRSWTGSEEHPSAGRSFLPDGRHFLYLARRGDEPRGHAICLGSLDLGREVEARAAASTHAEFAPPGLPALRAGAERSSRSRFDAGAREAHGRALPVAEQIAHVRPVAGSAFLGLEQRACSSTARRRPARVSSLWFDRAGKRLDDARRAGELLRLSRCRPTADGSRSSALDAGSATPTSGSSTSRAARLALHFDDGARTTARLVAGRQPDRLLLGPRGRPDVSVEPTSGSGEEKLVCTTGETTWQPAGPATGSYALSTRIGRRRPVRDLWALPLRSEASRSPLRRDRFTEVARPMFSPDGRWFAYASDESGRDEIYVQTLSGRRRASGRSPTAAAPSALARRRQGARTTARPIRQLHGGRDPRRLRSLEAGRSAGCSSPIRFGQAAVARPTPRPRDGQRFLVAAPPIDATSMPPRPGRPQLAGRARKKRWRSPPARGSAPTRSCRRSARAGWARCTGRGTRS